MRQCPFVLLQKQIMLRVNIPLLSKRVPPGWCLSLFDNPGFGDERLHISQIANESVYSSSVYIYLLDLRNIGGDMVPKFLNELKEKDEGNFVLFV